MSNPWGMAPQGRTPRSGPQPRTVAWIIAGLVVVILLVRSHHLNESTVFIIVAVIPSVILHEVSHGVAALACGDDTAKRSGRLTLNPVPHFDPLGTLIMPVLMALTVYGAVGWAKPMPVTPSRLRHPKNQKVLVALAGVATNLVLAVVLGLAWKFSTPQIQRLGVAPASWWSQLLFAAGFVNALLAVFYLIPIPPLDGAAIVDRFLPPHLVVSYHRIEPYTYFIPLVIFLFDQGAFLSFFDWIGNHWIDALGLYS